MVSKYECTHGHVGMMNSQRGELTLEDTEVSILAQRLLISGVNVCA